MHIGVVLNVKYLHWSGGQEMDAAIQVVCVAGSCRTADISQSLFLSIVILRFGAVLTVMSRAEERISIKLTDSIVQEETF